MVTAIRTGAVVGIEGFAVTVEVDISRGLPGFYLVGLPTTAVKESRERVLAALRHSGIGIPSGKVVVNLAPAGIRKEGAAYDLAIVTRGARRPFQMADGLDRLLGDYREAGGAPVTRADIHVH